MSAPRIEHPDWHRRSPSVVVEVKRAGRVQVLTKRERVVEVQAPEPAREAGE